LLERKFHLVEQNFKNTVYKISPRLCQLIVPKNHARKKIITQDKRK